LPFRVRRSPPWKPQRATRKRICSSSSKLIKQLRESGRKPSIGTKTIARIAKIDEILKSRGPTTLKELERTLGIDRATMTRLLGKLDMRRYDLHSRPGDEREKVLRLKAQIR
jgi:predicted HTH transcriptional regulator